MDRYQSVLPVGNHHRQAALRHVESERLLLHAGQRHLRGPRQPGARPIGEPHPQASSRLRRHLRALLENLRLSHRLIRGSCLPRHRHARRHPPLHRGRGGHCDVLRDRFGRRLTDLRHRLLGHRRWIVRESSQYQHCEERRRYGHQPPRAESPRPPVPPPSEELAIGLLGQGHANPLGQRVGHRRHGWKRRQQLLRHANVGHRRCALWAGLDMGGDRLECVVARLGPRPEGLM